MNQTRSPFADTAVPLPIAQREAILARCASDAPWLVAIFDDALQAQYFNREGQKWLNQNMALEPSLPDLLNLVGVGFVDAVRNVWVPQARVLGCWTGNFTIRDAWGVERAVSGRLTFGRRCDPKQRDVFVLAAYQQSVAESTRRDCLFLRALLDALPENVYFKDRHSRFLRVSRSLALKDGLGDPSLFIGQTDFDRFTVEHARVAYEDEQRIIRTGEPLIEHEEKETWPDGRVAWVSTSKFPLREENGEIVGTFGISRDITSLKLAEREREEMETQLRLAQKLEAIGGLAAGIAHEINTPTQFITDNTRFLVGGFEQVLLVMRRYEELAEALKTAAQMPPQVQAALAAVQEADRAAETDYLVKEIPQTLQQTLEGLARITRIVCSMKEFSHTSSPDLVPTNINHAIETALTVSRHEWKYVAELTTEFDPALPLVPCLVDEFGQVMLNLVINAAHAIQEVARCSLESSPPLGRITVRTRREEDAAVIEVSDTGGGIPAAIRDRIFDPFFTTKGVGKGTGQGLSIVRNVIVKRHRGSIDFTTEEGVGTTFRIHLPLTPHTVEAAPAAAAAISASP